MEATLDSIALTPDGKYATKQQKEKDLQTHWKCVQQETKYA